jgi:zinc transporter
LSFTRANPPRSNQRCAQITFPCHEILEILTLVTVLALPINVVTGLLGMNVGGLPLSQHPQGFLLVVGILAIVTGVLAYFLLIRRRD